MPRMEGTPQESPDTFASLEAEWKRASARNNSQTPSPEEQEIEARMQRLITEDPEGYETYKGQSNQDSGSGDRYRGRFPL